MATKPAILVVEDEAALRKAVARMLEHAGYEVTTAATGEDAVAHVGERFDVVLTDLRLPGAINGNEVTRRFRAEGTADVVIMTGYPELDTAVQGMQAGAYDYLIKPVAEHFLLAVIARCLHKRALSSELARERAMRAELDKAHQELTRLNKVRAIFGQFATPEVARLVLAHPEDFQQRRELKNVTIMFVDVRAFTTFAAAVTPEAASEALNEVFGALQDRIHPEGGILNKLLGDGGMAVFGAPMPLKEHSAACARAALAVQDTLGALARRREAQGLQGLRVGIGINSGTVMTGCLGLKGRTEYSVIGPAVNLAARLEKVALPGQILVGPETSLALEPEFALKEMGMMAFRGVKEVVPVHALLGRKVRIPAKAGPRPKET